MPYKITLITILLTHFLTANPLSSSSEGTSTRQNSFVKHYAELLGHRNVKVMKVEDHRILIRTESGGMRGIDTNRLPEHILSDLGITMEQAISATAKHQQDSSLTKQPHQVASSAVRAALLKQKVIFTRVKVISITDTGALVNATQLTTDPNKAKDATRNYSNLDHIRAKFVEEEMRRENPDYKPQPWEHTAIIHIVDWGLNLYDGAIAKDVTTLPYGTFSYNTASNSSATVPQYTTNGPKALKYYQSNRHGGQ